MDANILKKCKLCPRECNVDRLNGEVGFCGCGYNVKIARVGLHKWEEPCICSGAGSGTVFFSGCNLRCIYCQNREIALNDSSGKFFSVSELAEQYLRLQNAGACNINLVTPTPWVPFIKESLDVAWKNGLYLPVIYNCGGYESVDAIKTLRGYIAVYLTDYKYSSDNLSADYSFVPDYSEKCLRAIEEMIEQKGEPFFSGDTLLRGVIVRHLVLPGQVDNSVNAVRLLRKYFGDSVIYSIMNQYTPFGCLPDELNRTVTSDEYNSVLSEAEGVRYLIAQEGGASSESFVPHWGEYL